MNEENTNRLLWDFPGLYDFYYSEVAQPYPMTFGFECGDGWFNLIYELSEKLSKDPMVKAVQVKEKFGGLRFYVNTATEEQWDYINKAEEESFRVCEVCGKPGIVRGGIWLKTLCEECVR